MVDVSKITYKVYLLRENGEQINITNIASDVNWEENEGELAQRVSIRFANIVHNGSRISSLAKLNCYIIVKAEIAGKSEEVARGKIVEWSPERSGNTDDLPLMGYDVLYDLQSSQDNRYVSAGVSTETALKSIFSDWGIPIAKYDGPKVAQAKTVFKNEYLSDIVLELLDAAHKHGAAECIVRSIGNKVAVLQKASNTTIYCFEESENLEMTNYSISTADMVTVVKVVASEDTKGRQAVEAIIKGKTEYGKRQRIYVRDKDDTLATATAAAKKILAEEGQPKTTMSVKAPDIPMIRKGDKVKITSRLFSGYMIVLSVQHDATNKSMSMELKKYDANVVNSSSSNNNNKSYQVGDVVNFHGGVHYVSSTATSPRGGTRKAGKAKITYTNPGSKHPYHLVGGAYNSLDGNCNVYGWVDTGTFS